MGIINQQTVLEGQPLVLPACQCGMLENPPGLDDFSRYQPSVPGIFLQARFDDTNGDFSYISLHHIYIPIRIRKIRSRNYNPLNHPNQVDRTATKKNAHAQSRLVHLRQGLGAQGVKVLASSATKMGPPGEYGVSINGGTLNHGF